MRAADLAAETHARDVLEIRARQTTLATLRILQPDPDAVHQALTERVSAAPAMLDAAPVVLDLGACASEADETRLNALLEVVRASGPRPIAVLGSSVLDGWAATHGMPRLGGEDGAGRSEATRWSDGHGNDARAVDGVGTAADDERVAGGAVRPAGASPGAVRVVEAPVRSGQQIYARGAHLLLLGAVSAGAEVLADGHIHVYGALRGRALAGVQGDTDARITTTSLEAELVSVAGHYQISEHLDPDLRGVAAQVRIDGHGQLRILAI